jgi:hypothetical protein
VRLAAVSLRADGRLHVRANVALCHAF